MGKIDKLPGAKQARLGQYIPGVSANFRVNLLMSDDRHLFDTRDELSRRCFHGARPRGPPRHAPPHGQSNRRDSHSNEEKELDKLNRHLVRENPMETKEGDQTKSDDDRCNQNALCCSPVFRSYGSVEFLECRGFQQVFDFYAVDQPIDGRAVLSPAVNISARRPRFHTLARFHVGRLNRYPPIPNSFAAVPPTTALVTSGSRPVSTTWSIGSYSPMSNG